MVKGANGEKWVCCACMKTTSADDWEIEAFVAKPAPERDLLVLKCPACGRSLVYRFLYHGQRTLYAGN